MSGPRPKAIRRVHHLQGGTSLFAGLRLLEAARMQNDLVLAAAAASAAARRSREKAIEPAPIETRNDRAKIKAARKQRLRTRRR